MNIALFRNGLWIAIVVALAAATLAFFLIRTPAGYQLGGGTYALVDDTGQPVGPDMFKGHPSLLFFGYTHCPDVCPTTLSEMAVWFHDLGGESAKLRAFYVTVDPERDSQDIIHGYVTAFTDRITGVTGPRPEIDKIIAAWRVVAEKVPSSDGGYTMNHTASVFLVDSLGSFVGTIAYGEEEKTALEKIRRLLKAG